MAAQHLRDVKFGKLWKKLCQCHAFATDFMSVN